MTGTGEVVKRRLVEGSGEFPMDCPLNDTTMRLHYRVRRGGGEPGQPPSPWVFDTRTPGPAAAAGAGGDAPQPADDSPQPPVEIDTGEWVCRPWALEGLNAWSCCSRRC